MTSLRDVGQVVDQAWQAFQAEERQARAAYLAAVEEAQRNFDEDVKPAIDTYHSVERAAWQAYNMTSRAAKRRYFDYCATGGATGTVGKSPATDYTTDTWGTAQTASHVPEPTFTPTQESGS